MQSGTFGFRLVFVFTQFPPRRVRSLRPLCLFVDGLKIYPTLVIRGTGLYELYKTGAYKNYSPEVLIELLARIMAMVPPWTRVYRVQRDIPMPLVTSGVKHGNIRELVLKRMSDLGMCF